MCTKYNPNKKIYRKKRINKNPKNKRKHFFLGIWYTYTLFMLVVLWIVSLKIVFPSAYLRFLLQQYWIWGVIRQGFGAVNKVFDFLFVSSLLGALNIHTYIGRHAVCRCHKYVISCNEMKLLTKHLIWIIYFGKCLPIPNVSSDSKNPFTSISRSCFMFNERFSSILNDRKERTKKNVSFP